MGGEFAQATAFGAADAVFDPGVGAVGGIQIGQVVSEGVGMAGWQAGNVGREQVIAPAVVLFKQRELRAWMRAFPTGDDPRTGRPAVQPAGGANQVGEIGDLGCVHDLTVLVAAGAGLPLGVEGDLPDLLGNQPNGSSFPLTELPAHRPPQHRARPGGQRAWGG